MKLSVSSVVIYIPEKIPVRIDEIYKTLGGQILYRSIPLVPRSKLLRYLEPWVARKSLRFMTQTEKEKYILLTL